MDLLKDLSAFANKAKEILSSDAAQQVIKAVANSPKDKNGEIDIAAGLKEALKVGIQAAATKLGAQDGYLADMAVKIGLPKEASTTFGAIQSLASNQAFNNVLNVANINIPSYDTVVTLFNRAAENAAPKSVDTFVNAITGMTIEDGKNILFGADSAATQYLKGKTYQQLQSTFIPTITSSLNTIKVANITPVQAWNVYATYNNKLVNLLDSSAVKTALEIAKKTGILKEEYIAALDKIDLVNTDIAGHVTTKALDGLFLKVSDKETDIRHDVNARVNDTLKNVFGLLDQK